MALLMHEKQAYINGNDGLKEIQVPAMDGALLMSLLLEESHGEECYSDEQLNSVMQSLEAEINIVNAMKDAVHAALDMELEGEESLSSDAEEIDCDDRLVLSSLDFDCIGWTDMELPVTSLPSDDMNWYPEEMDGMVDLEEGYGQNFFGVNLDDQHDYSSLWHGIQDHTAMVN